MLKLGLVIMFISRLFKPKCRIPIYITANKVPVTEHFFIFNRMVFHKLGRHTHLSKRNHLVCRLNVLLPTAQTLKYLKLECAEDHFFNEICLIQASILLPVKCLIVWRCCYFSLSAVMLLKIVMVSPRLKITA